MFAMRSPRFLEGLEKEITKLTEMKPSDQKSIKVLDALVRLHEEITKEKASALTDAPMMICCL